MLNYPDKYSRFVENSKFTSFLEDLRMKFISDSITYHKPKSLLDIGCGFNPVSSYCGYTPLIYAVVEPNPPKDLNVPNLYDCKLEDIKYHEKYDMIVISSVLHIVDNVSIFLCKVKEFCKKNTILYVNVPNAFSMHRVLGVHMGLLNNLDDLSSTDIEFGHKRVFTMQTLKSKIGKYFTVTNYGSYLLKPFSDEQMNKLIESDSSILIGLTKMIELFQDFGCEIWVEAIV